VTSRSVEEKKSESHTHTHTHTDSHRKDMSPLTQGLNYRSACDDTVKLLIKAGSLI